MPLEMYDYTMTYELPVKDQITWHFNPPQAPHTGGYWEAAVKSVKFHLRRVLGNTAITYEEMYTLLVQIEACLNSRPLTPLSNDPSDYLPLTPAHFLIGDSLASIPQADVRNENPNRLLDICDFNNWPSNSGIAGLRSI
nr:unnamed protein product [Callosobruchus analis]